MFWVGIIGEELICPFRVPAGFKDAFDGPWLDGISYVVTSQEDHLHA